MVSYDCQDNIQNHHSFFHVNFGMRIIGRIPHPSMQISVFSNDGRFPVQFELSGQSQIYRFRQSDTIKGLDDIKKLVDSDFTNCVMQQFRAMKRIQSEVFERHTPPLSTDDSDSLPDIF